MSFKKNINKKNFLIFLFFNTESAWFGLYDFLFKKWKEKYVINKFKIKKRTSVFQ